MTLTPAQIGLLGGAALGLVSFGLIRSVAARVEGMKPTPEQQRTGGVLRMVALIDLIAFPVIGYFIVPMVMK